MPRARVPGPTPTWEGRNSEEEQQCKEAMFVAIGQISAGLYTGKAGLEQFGPLIFFGHLLAIAGKIFK